MCLIDGLILIQIFYEYLMHDDANAIWLGGERPWNRHDRITRHKGPL